MPGGIDRWLQGIGLSKYTALFAENEIGLDVLPDLTDADFEKLSIPLGDRKRLLKAVASLSERPEEPAAPEVSPAPSGDAERRQVTVMFVDLVGSTALSGRLDPEDLREVMRRYQDAAAGAITRFGGHVAKFLGDGVLAYFGWPRAHEDQAERAVRAGLDAVAAVQGVTADDGALHTRVGIATGEVVIGDMVGETVSESDAIIGETPNLAARLQGVAKPDQVVISAATRRLIGESFALDDFGAQKLKGIKGKVPAWRVTGERAAVSRFEAAHAGRLTAFVGREEEVELLLKRWRQAKAGEGQVALLSGEAGIGKSRITQALRERLANEPHTRLRYQCSPFLASTAFHPFLRQLERAAGMAPDDTPDSKLDKIEALLAQSTESVSDVVPLVAALLSVPTGDRYPPLDLTPSVQKEKTLEALTDQLLGLAAQRPVLLIFEDAHWVDPTSLDALERMIDRIQGASVLVIITCRPEFTPPWSGHTHTTTLSLNRLGREPCAAMVESVTGGKALPVEVLGQIVAKTDGVPLFVEELTKTVLETGLLREEGESYVLTGPLPSLALPATLRDSLVARLDRLGEAKEIAQVGAVIGRDFSYDLLAAVVDRTEVEINAALDRLILSGMVFRRGVPPAATYTFKHALVQDAAYATLLISRRQQLHALIVQVIEGQGGDQPIEMIDLLAHHAYQGEVWEKAFTYLRQAGLNAMNRSALREAVTQFERALLAWSHLPATREAQEQAIDLRFDLRNALWSLGEFEEILAYLRDAERLAKTLDDPRRIGWVSVYMSASLWQLGRSEEARKSAQAALASAESGDLALEVAGNHYLGCAYVTSGDYRRAETLFLKIVEALAADLSHEHYGLPFLPAVICRSWLVWALAERGEFDGGIAHGQEGVHLAEEVGHPFSRAHIYYDLGYLHGVKGDFDHAVDALERAFALVREWNLTFMSPFIMGFLGHVNALSGRVAEGTSLLQQALSDYETIGLGLFRSLVGVQLGEAFLLAHRVEDAFASAERALELARNRAERGHEAHALRLLGEIAAHPEPPDVEIAQGHYREALTLAETLGMRPLVAHCHRGLGRLYGREGKRQEAEEYVARAVAMYRDMGMRFWYEQANAMG